MTQAPSNETITKSRGARPAWLIVVLAAVAIIGLSVPVYQRAHLVSQGPYSWCPQNPDARGDGSIETFSMSVLPFGITCSYAPRDARSGSLAVYHDLGTVPGAIGALALLGLLVALASRGSSRGSL